MDYEIERDLIGNILLNPEIIKRMVISEECFLDIKNRFIFKLLCKQYNDYKTINIVGIVENYKHLFNDKFRSDEMISIMTDIMNETIPTNNIDYLQETIFERYIRYRILEEIKKYQRSKISTEEMLNNIHKYESMSIKANDNKLSADEIFDVINSKNKTINFRLDKLSAAANIQEHDLVVVAARPGTGKTGFILNILEDLSKKYNCLYFNMEMSEKQVYQRLVAINTSVAMKYHDSPETDYQLSKIKEGCKEIANRKIKVISTGQNISTLRRKIISESKNEHTIAFIDYVGLIGSVDKSQSNYERVTSIVKELRQISLDYDCTIFLVSQINRNSENQKDKTPKISDLKESGELEQSATTVLMLYNENVHLNVSDNEIEIECIIGKNRNGRVGSTKLIYNKENQRFNNINIYRKRDK